MNKQLKGFGKEKGEIYLLKYILKRLLYAVLTLWVLVTVTFFMMRLLPGDPFIGPKALPEATMQALKEKYGLDKPVISQYVQFLGNTVKGDLGISTHYKGRSVNDIIAAAFPYSFDLGMRALIFAVIMGVLLGIFAARKRGTPWDTVSMLVAVIGVSVPSFIVGAVLQYCLSLQLNEFLGNFWPGTKIFPVYGWDTEMSKIIPAFALSLGSLATISRLMRTSMLDVFAQDYIKTAKAKGLNDKQIVWRHAVRNAIMPIITVLGPISATILTGAFVVENIFNIPGMGKFFVQSIQTSDYPLIAGTTLFYGAFLIIANLIVDIAYGLVDPRVKLGKE